MRIGMFAGEESGDVLGADLICQLKKKYPQADFIGVGGNRMIQQGLDSLYPIENFSVMGIIEPLKRLATLWRLRKDIAFFLQAANIDIFISIDSPDYSLGLAKILKKKGIKTLHYVSPSVWAWRSKRVHKVNQSVDYLLCLFPHEVSYYKGLDVKAYFVGHPAARNFLEGKIKPNQLAILPGSRQQELVRYAPIFRQIIDILISRNKDIQPVVVLANKEHKIYIAQSLGHLPVSIQNVPEILSQSKATLAASGTAVLEAFLAGSRAVAVALSGRVTEYIFNKYIFPNIGYVSLPNILLSKSVVKEYVSRKQLDVHKIALSLEEALQDTSSEYSENIVTVRDKLTPKHSAVDIIAEIL